MSTRPNPFLPLPWLAGLALLAPAALAGEAPSLTAETFGAASGDVPMRGLGLVLELVQEEGVSPVLRLFGGAPGHPATILVSAGRRATPLAGPRGTSLLVGAPARTIEGAFDARGRFEVSLEALADLPADLVIYAQGLHTGIVPFADGPLIQASHGIEIARRADEQGAVAFDELLPHLPAARELGKPSDLAELLQTALDSAGDSLRLKIEVEGTGGLGIEIVDGKLGGNVEVEFAVARGADGVYETSVGAEVAMLAGVSAGFGAEAGVEGALGGDGTMIYRFHSAPGAARGMLGIVAALLLPAQTPGADWLEAGFLGDASARADEVRVAIAALREQADHLEETLEVVLDLNLATAETLRAKALAARNAAASAVATASWHQLPARLAQLAARNGILAVATANRNAARVAHEHGIAAVVLVRAQIEAKRAELSAVAEGLARAGRIASALSQLRPYTVAHYDGEEIGVARTLEVEAKIGLPVVDVAGLESSLIGELARGVRLRFERETATRPLRLTVTGRSETSLALVYAQVQGVEARRARTIEVAQTFERTATGWAAAGGDVGFAVDVQAGTGAGCGIYAKSGVGRAWSVSLGDAASLVPGGIAAVTSIEGLIAHVGPFEIALELQDRRWQEAGFSFSADVNGTGGGIEIEAQWCDQGRLLSRATTVAEGVETILQGPSQAISKSGGVTVLD
jgi:hypothetical protein